MWLRLEQLLLDETLYPRTGTNWQTIAKYKEAMESGVQFPPILVGKTRKSVNIRGKRLPVYVVLDGWHRIGATKAKGDNKILAVETQKPKEEWFIEAAAANVSHGLALSAYDIARIIQRLKEQGVPGARISEIVKMRPERVEKFLTDRIVRDVAGNETIVKASLRHLVSDGSNLTQERLQEFQEGLSGHSQIGLLDELIRLIENDLLDFENKAIKERLERLEKCLSGCFSTTSGK
jgi:DNA-binding transcriptional MerR regulator